MVTTTSLEAPQVNQRPVWREEDFTVSRVSLAKLCATAQLVGYVRGLVQGGALSEGHSHALADILARYEAAQ